MRFSILERALHTRPTPYLYLAFKSRDYRYTCRFLVDTTCTIPPSQFSMRLIIVGFMISLASITLLDFIIQEQSHQQRESYFNRDADTRYKAGFRIYKTHCQNCHGNQGDGRGSYSGLPTNMGLANFIDPNYDRPKKEIKQIIREGGQAYKMSPLMPAWKTLLTDDEISDVAYFIKRINQEGYIPRPDRVASTNLD